MVVISPSPVMFPVVVSVSFPFSSRSYLYCPRALPVHPSDLPLPEICGICLPLRASPSSTPVWSGVDPVRGFSVCAVSSDFTVSVLPVLFAFLPVRVIVSVIFCRSLFSFVSVVFLFPSSVRCRSASRSYPGAVRAGDRRFRCRLAALDGRSVSPLCRRGPPTSSPSSLVVVWSAGGGGILLGHRRVTISRSRLGLPLYLPVGRSGEGGGAEQPDDARLGDQ